jgi:hypothetical protein
MMKEERNSEAWMIKGKARKKPKEDELDVWTLKTEIWQQKDHWGE